ncbi:Alpha/Beta hydrolase protein [Fusarium acuminatum]|uniref:Alpha/Beta hydrolase protein n=1 Tax=Fusarium acuminatum TaxID=5515 RepID=A0ABZ2X7D1_9HYPO
MSYTVGGIKVLQRDSPSPTLPHAQYPGLKQETVVLPRGHRKDPSRKAFRAESILEKDVQVVTRNGHILQADVYRPAETKEQVPALLAWSPYGKSGTGSHKAEDIIGMLDQYPLQNAYWADKRADMSKINVPAYVLASYSTVLHTVGSFRGFEEIPHDNKWLRVHSTQEWYDLYSDECVEDLQLFFDRYLKDKQNGWEETPRVRLSTLAFNKGEYQEPEINHHFTDWPLPETNYITLYLSDENRLLKAPSSKGAILSYQSDVPDMQVDAQVGELSFEYTFKERTYLIGYPRAVLYMSTEDSNDMDVFVSLRKADSQGNLLRNINIPLKDLGMEADEVPLVNPLVYIGPSGILRASHRKVDAAKSKPYWPFHPHDERELLEPGQIVKLDIGLWPAGIVFEAGEKLMLRVSGHHMVLAEFEPLRGGFKTDNKGRHNVHVGPEYQSHVILPFVHSDVVCRSK